MECTTRPLSDKEAKVLQPKKIIHPTIEALGSWAIAAALGFVIWSFIYLPFLYLFHAPNFARVAASIPTLIYAWWIGRDILRTKSSQKYYAERNRLYALDRAGGFLEIRTYHVTNVIQVKEEEDEGDHFFLRMNDGAILFLSGQYLYNSDEVDEVEFPCTEFDLIVAPHSKIVFDLVRRGTHLQPSKKLKPFRREQYRAKQVPQDLDLIDTPWEEIEARYSPKVTPKKARNRRRP